MNEQESLPTLLVLATGAGHFFRVSDLSGIVQSRADGHEHLVNSDAQPSEDGADLDGHLGDDLAMKDQAGCRPEDAEQVKRFVTGRWIAQGHGLSVSQQVRS